MAARQKSTPVRWASGLSLWGLFSWVMMSIRKTIIPGQWCGQSSCIWSLYWESWKSNWWILRCESLQDCLSLNIYCPESGEGLLPVLVWIHGASAVFTVHHYHHHHLMLTIGAPSPSPPDSLRWASINIFSKLSWLSSLICIIIMNIANHFFPHLCLVFPLRAQ